MQFHRKKKTKTKQKQTQEYQSGDSRLHSSHFIFSSFFADKKLREERDCSAYETIEQSN